MTHYTHTCAPLTVVVRVFFHPIFGSSHISTLWLFSEKSENFKLLLYSWFITGMWITAPGDLCTAGTKMSCYIYNILYSIGCFAYILPFSARFIHLDFACLLITFFSSACSDIMWSLILFYTVFIHAFSLFLLLLIGFLLNFPSRWKIAVSLLHAQL